MFYAHFGSSSDNAFTTYDGTPTREFLAFNTKEDRQKAQDEIWLKSKKETNLIFCTSAFVKQYNGRDFMMVPVKGTNYFYVVDETFEENTIELAF